MMTARLLTADDVAAIVGMTKDWIYAEVRAGRIPHVKLGRYDRFREESIAAWIEGIETASNDVPRSDRGRIRASCYGRLLRSTGCWSRLESGVRRPLSRPCLHFLPNPLNATGFAGAVSLAVDRRP